MLKVTRSYVWISHNINNLAIFTNHSVVCYFVALFCQVVDPHNIFRQGRRFLVDLIKILKLCMLFQVEIPSERWNSSHIYPVKSNKAEFLPSILSKWETNEQNLGATTSQCLYRLLKHKIANTFYGSGTFDWKLVFRLPAWRGKWIISRLEALRYPY